MSSLFSLLLALSLTFCSQAVAEPTTPSEEALPAVIAEIHSVQEETTPQENTDNIAAGKNSNEALENDIKQTAEYSSPTPKISEPSNNPPAQEAYSFQQEILPEAETITVYITNTGSKYHSLGCQYLRKSCIPISLNSAKLSYSPCSKCHPPQ